jgi:hypothetical protein
VNWLYFIKVRCAETEGVVECIGGNLIWIMLAGYAFAGNFGMEVKAGGDLGFASYSEAGHHAPASPVAPTKPNPSLKGLALMPGQEASGAKDLGMRSTALGLLNTMAGSSMLGQLSNGASAKRDDTLQDDSLATIVRNVRQEVYSDSRLTYMKRASGVRKLRTDQLASLLGLLTFSDDRIALIAGVGSQVLDSENYPNLYRFFPFQSDRDTVEALF